MRAEGAGMSRNEGGDLAASPIWKLDSFPAWFVGCYKKKILNGKVKPKHPRVSDPLPHNSAKGSKSGLCMKVHIKHLLTSSAVIFTPTWDENKASSIYPFAGRRGLLWKPIWTRIGSRDSKLLPPTWNMGSFILFSNRGFWCQGTG